MPTPSLTFFGDCVAKLVEIFAIQRYIKCHASIIDFLYKLNRTDTDTRGEYFREKVKVESTLVFLLKIRKNVFTPPFYYLSGLWRFYLIDASTNYKVGKNILLCKVTQIF